MAFARPKSSRWSLLDTLRILGLGIEVHLLCSRDETKACEDKRLECTHLDGLGILETNERIR